MSNCPPYIHNFLCLIHLQQIRNSHKIEPTYRALPFFYREAATALVEGKIGKSLKKVLKKVVAKEAHEELAVSDAKLGGVIKVSDQICVKHSACSVSSLF